MLPPGMEKRDSIGIASDSMYIQWCQDALLEHAARAQVQEAAEEDARLCHQVPVGAMKAPHVANSQRSAIGCGKVPWQIAHATVLVTK